MIFKTLGMINTYQSLILAETTHAVPFAVWLLTGSFAALPRELEDLLWSTAARRFRRY